MEKRTRTTLGYVVIAIVYTIIINNRRITGQLTQYQGDSCDSSESLNSCEIKNRLDAMILMLEQQQQRITHLEQLKNSTQPSNNAGQCALTGSETSVPAQCCSFPFTRNGSLYYRCIPGLSNPALGCFISKRTWVTCSGATDYIAPNTTLNNYIPTSSWLTQSVLSINNWIVFQQRLDESTNFNRSWADYKNGFGIYNGNYWIGLENLYRLTSNGRCMLRIEVLMQAGQWLSDEYDTFYIDGESLNYTLHIDGRYGDGGDAMDMLTQNYAIANLRPFSTYDRSSASSSATPNCALFFSGGWWYTACHWVNLNGRNNTMGFAINNGLTLLSASRMMLKKM